MFSRVDDRLSPLVGDAAASLDLMDAAARLDHLEARLSATENALATVLDELAVLRLVASYFPLVDSGQAEDVAGLWTEDGVYDVDTGALHGRREIRDMVRGEEHQQLIAWGAGHVPGLPHVVVDGDRAVVTGHSQLVVRSRKPGRFTCVRVTTHRWELERAVAVASGSDRGWRVLRRTARLIDESGAARALLAGAAGPDDRA